MPDGFEVYFGRGIEGIGVGAVGAWNEVWVVKTNSDAEFGAWRYLDDAPRRVWKPNVPTLVSTADQVANICSNTGLPLPIVDYGCGQPSVAINPSGGPSVLAYRVPVSLAPNTVVNGDRTNFVNAGNPGARLNVEANPHGVEDGPSSEVFWYEGLLYRLFGETNFQYLRRYAYDPAKGLLVREWQSECQIVTPLVKTWRIAPAGAKGLDGQLGVVRSADNQVLVGADRTISYWGAVLGADNKGAKLMMEKMVLPTTTSPPTTIVPPTTVAGSTVPATTTTTLPCL